MNLKKNECDILNKKQPSDEGKWIIQIKELSVCYLEMLTPFAQLLEYQNEYWIKKSSLWLEHTLNEFKNKCTQSRLPTHLKLTEEQKNTLLKETLPLIQKNCYETLNTMQDQMELFNKKFFIDNSSPLLKLIQKIKKLATSITLGHT